MAFDSDKATVVCVCNVDGSSRMFQSKFEISKSPRRSDASATGSETCASTLSASQDNSMARSQRK